MAGIPVAGLIVGTVALVMAVSPLAQLLFGRPKLSLQINESQPEGTTAKALECQIYNKPFRSKLLRAAGASSERSNPPVSAASLQGRP